MGASSSRWAMGACALLLASALGCAAIPAPRESLHDPGALLFNGYANPNSNCYRCHGADARGSGRGPDLVLASKQLRPEMMEMIIREGSGRMPAYGEKLSADDIQALLAWVQSQTTPTLPPDRALQGER
jgi:mono/diheme cytochrome c family protein